VRSRRFARFGPVGTRFAGHGPSFPGLGGCGWPRGLWLAVAARRQLPVPEAGRRRRGGGGPAPGQRKAHGPGAGGDQLRCLAGRRGRCGPGRGRVPGG
jgi:hypothetical protein